MRILVTGGAGFVGSNLATTLKRRLPGAELCAFDNLRRRGSESALPRLRDAGVDFVHGDVRCPADLASAGRFDALVECSAEPSVHAGYAGNPAYVIDTNLIGTAHCLEAARAHGANVIFLSTSRVYPIDRLRGLPLERHGDRLDLDPSDSGSGWSFEGITTDFPLAGHRSLYGATKLAAELLVEEYGAMYGLRTVINRCGVIAGPWQMGKVDQGFVVWWAASHLFGKPLTYRGFGGDGLQVRDVLHIDDLCELIHAQLQEPDRCAGRTFNVGGGRAGSVSLAELTLYCCERAGRAAAIGREPDTQHVDIPYYVTDNAPVTSVSGWRPVRGIERTLDDVFSWLTRHRALLEPLLFETAARPELLLRG